jgi:hypothetical protein
MIKEHVEGMNEPILVFTPEEDTRDLTGERFFSYMNHIGEDFCDQEGHIIDGGLLAKFLAEHKDNAQVPERVYLVTEAAKDGADALELLHAYEEVGEIEDDTEIFYEHLAEFVNLYPELKKQINHILTEAMED